MCNHTPSVSRYAGRCRRLDVALTFGGERSPAYCGPTRAEHRERLLGHQYFCQRGPVITGTIAALSTVNSCSALPIFLSTRAGHHWDDRVHRCGWRRTVRCPLRGSSSRQSGAREAGQYARAAPSSGWTPRQLLNEHRLLLKDWHTVFGVDAHRVNCTYERVFLRPLLQATLTT